MKLCIDCVHYQEKGSRCDVKKSPVDGKAQAVALFMREDEDQCGMQARWFDPAPPKPAEPQPGSWVKVGNPPKPWKWHWL